MNTSTTTTQRVGATTANVRARRETVGLTRAQLAIRAAVSLTHLANIEAGVLPATGDALGRILDALAVVEAEPKPGPRAATLGPTQITDAAGGRGAG
jgi:transcriptional regulator with XRE-family HTH domain